MSKIKKIDVVVVGAGFAGMYMLHRLRGLGFSVGVFERASDVGGTWYWNRYPGARCDVESMQYSYSFDRDLEQEWHWSERFASQPEILRYARHVADRLNLRQDIKFNTSVVSAIYDDDSARWTIRTDSGDLLSAQFCIMATGCLSTSRQPEFSGLDRFTGKTYHTGKWPHEGVDLSGLRVGVIGTGSSAIQAIPVIAEQSKHLTVFQRTPNFSIPTRNKPMDADYEQWWKQAYPEHRAVARMQRAGYITLLSENTAMEVSEAERQRIYEERWALGGTSFMAAFTDLSVSKASNDTAANFVRSKIRGIVADPAVAEILCPHNHPIGTKRICVDSQYYETYNRPNLTLVDVRNAPIEKITERGVSVSGRHFDLDVIVFATGFDAMTGTLVAINPVGREGVTLSGAWDAGPRTYLGLMSAQFPNMFMITGPGSPSVLSNMIVSIEQHVDWIADCLGYMRSNGIASIEPRLEAQDTWVAHVNEMAFRTLYPTANSWYMGANIPGKPQVFMPYIGGVGAYRQKCDEVAAEGYVGFDLGRQDKTTAVAAK